MKKYLVIGNPIEHSLSPLIHNYWIKKYRLANSVYEKKKVEKKDLKVIVDQVRNGQIKGLNITVPFKKEIIDLLDCVHGQPH
jgi:shikimate dehydrogenase